MVCAKLVLLKTFCIVYMMVVMMMPWRSMVRTVMMILGHKLLESEVEFCV